MNNSSAQSNSTARPGSAAQTRLQLERVSADYGATPVLREFSLEVAGGELMALLGPSGCGKTTVLKLIAGLLPPVSGEVRFNGESINHLPAEKRGAVMVFQKPLLFPYLTVAENVAFGLKMRRTRASEQARRVREALRLVQLEGYEARRPKELSGGQEQRVALARALITEPRVLLLDEPFSALDEHLRAEMRALVRGLQRRLRITMIFVTHDQAEAAALADRIALLLDGRLEQCGAPRDFYTAPRTPRAARFFGWKVIAGQRCGPIIETVLGRFALPASAAITESSTDAAIAFRPERARLARLNGQTAASGENQMTGTILAAVDLGARVRYTVALSDELIEIEQEADGGGPLLESGAHVTVDIPGEALRLLPQE
jgi:ABC-type Fe3+/spermidine/putrescine transport system ATPase subunit